MTHEDENQGLGPELLRHLKQQQTALHDQVAAVIETADAGVDLAAGVEVQLEELKKRVNSLVIEVNRNRAKNAVTWEFARYVLVTSLIKGTVAMEIVDQAMETFRVIRGAILEVDDVEVEGLGQITTLVGNSVTDFATEVQALLDSSG